METDTKMEKVAFSLSASSYDGDEEPVEVSFADLRKAKVGDKWENTDSHSCGRALREESAEVVYKTDKGAAGPGVGPAHPGANRPPAPLGGQPVPSL